MQGFCCTTWRSGAFCSTRMCIWHFSSLPNSKDTRWLAFCTLFCSLVCSSRALQYLVSPSVGGGCFSLANVCLWPVTCWHGEGLFTCTDTHYTSTYHMHTRVHIHIYTHISGFGLPNNTAQIFLVFVVWRYYDWAWRKMAQQLEACAAFSEDLSSVPTLMSGGSWLPVTPAPGVWCLLLDSMGTFSYMHIPLHIYTKFKNNKNKLGKYYDLINWPQNPLWGCNLQFEKLYLCWPNLATTDQIQYSQVVRWALVEG